MSATMKSSMIATMKSSNATRTEFVDCDNEIVDRDDDIGDERDCSEIALR